MLARFELADAADRLAKTYSGGMARKLDVAIGLVHRPRVLFLDEPTTGLDPEARAAMWAEISRLCADEQTTILLTTHYLEEADRLADRVAIVDAGRIIVEGTPDELKSELRGDAVQVELAAAAQHAVAVLERVPGLREVSADGTRLRARADSGARAVPGRARRAGRQRHRGRIGDGRPSLAGRRVPAPRRPRVRRGGGGMSTTSAPPASTSQSALDGPRERARQGQSHGLLRHSGFLTARGVRTLLRQPAYLAITLVQPVIWLLLFGQLFRNVVHIPGFSHASGSYLEFITPGVIVMTALFSSGWAGTVYIEDMDRGVMDRLLASPVRRGAMIIGTLAYQSLTTTVQTLIVFGIAFAAGARFDGGPAGVLDRAGRVPDLGGDRVVLEHDCAARSPTGGAHRHQPVHRLAAAVPVLLDHGHPGLPRMGAPCRPVQPGRLGDDGRTLGAVGFAEWGAILPRLGLLLALAVVMGWLATRAFAPTSAPCEPARRAGSARRAIRPRRPPDPATP